MIVKVGDYIRTKYNKILFVDNIYEFFGVEGDEYDDYENKYVIGCNKNPQELINTNDLVEVNGDKLIVSVEENGDVYSNESKKMIIKDDVQKIWCLNNDDDYIKCWDKIN